MESIARITVDASTAKGINKLLSLQGEVGFIHFARNRLGNLIKKNENQTKHKRSQ